MSLLRVVQRLADRTGGRAKTEDIVIEDRDRHISEHGIQWAGVEVMSRVLCLLLCSVSLRQRMQVLAARAKPYSPFGPDQLY